MALNYGPHAEWQASYKRFCALREAREALDKEIEELREELFPDRQ
jgi:hypothetical protein